MISPCCSRLSLFAISLTFWLCRVGAATVRLLRASLTCVFSMPNAYLPTYLPSSISSSHTLAPTYLFCSAMPLPWYDALASFACSHVDSLYSTFCGEHLFREMDLYAASMPSLYAFPLLPIYVVAVDSRLDLRACCLTVEQCTSRLQRICA